METHKRSIRVDDQEWARLAGIAAGLVKDSELPPGASRGGGRVSALMRLIANGSLVVTRPGEDQEQEQQEQEQQE